VNVSTQPARNPTTSKFGFRIPAANTTFDSKTIAKQWAAHVESELRAGRYMPRAEAQRHTVRDYWKPIEKKS